MPLNIKAAASVATIFCLLQFSLISPEAKAAKKFYKWVDKNGVTHYSEKPPRGQSAEVVNTYTGRGTPAPRPEKKAADEEKKTEEPQSSEPAKDPQVCQAARKNLRILDQSHRVRLQSDNGELKTLSAEEKQKQRQKALDAVKQHCK